MCYGVGNYGRYPTSSHKCRVAGDCYGDLRLPGTEWLSQVRENGSGGGVDREAEEGNASNKAISHEEAVKL